MKNLIILTVLALTLGSAGAAYLESGDSQRVPELPNPPRIMPPPPDGAPALKSLIRRLEIGRAYHQSGLTVFPLRLRRSQSSQVLTMGEALRRGDLIIREKRKAQVSRLQVRNQGASPVFLMAGEIILGGKQNRIVRSDVLLPGRSGVVEIDVYCGEQDRWQGGKVAFQSSTSLTSPSLRRMAAGSASQDGIWREIDTRLEQAEVKSSTRNYHEIYDDQKVQRHVERCLEAFRKVPRSDTVGVAVFRGHRVLGVELFSDDDLFARLWPKICRSYAADLATPMPEPYLREKRRWPWPGQPGKSSVRRMLDNVLNAGFQRVANPGVGTYWNLNRTVTGNALEYDGSLVHATVFPDVVRIQPLR
jgi:hypothetical protein